jgi:hypothetical protein
MEDIVEFRGYKLLILDENKFCYKAMVLNSEIYCNFNDIEKKCNEWVENSRIRNAITQMRNVDSLTLSGCTGFGATAFALPLSFDEFREYQNIISHYEEGINSWLFTPWDDSHSNGVLLMSKGQGIKRALKWDIYPVAPVVLISKDIMAVETISTDVLIEELRKRAKN